jgi:hypothetical protein
MNVNSKAPPTRMIEDRATQLIIQRANALAVFKRTAVDKAMATDAGRLVVAEYANAEARRKLVADLPTDAPDSDLPECEHPWPEVVREDDSFDHAFGTESKIWYRCRLCDTQVAEAFYKD